MLISDNICKGQHIFQLNFIFIFELVRVINPMANRNVNLV